MSEKTITTCDFCSVQTVRHHNTYGGASLKELEASRAWRRYEGSDFCGEKCLHEWLGKKLGGKGKK